MISDGAPPHPTSVAGIPTHLRQAGQGDPLVLLHGLGASSYTWRHQIPVLSRQHAVYAPDFPGFGRSAKPADFDYTFAGFARWLDVLMGDLGLHNPVLVGSSMGGCVALRYCLEHPSRVRRLILIGTPVYPHNIPFLLWQLRRPLLGRLLEPFLGRWTVRLVAPTAFFDASLVTPDLLDEYALALQSRAGRRAAVETLRRLITPDIPDVIGSYGSLRTPVLCIRGDHDGVVDRASVERFCRSVLDARFLPIPDCGHLPQEETPEAVTTEISKFSIL